MNFHSQSNWHEWIGPLGSPEFALLDASGKVIYRWIGFTEKEEFDEVMGPDCAG